MTAEEFKEVCSWLKVNIAGTPREGHLYAVGGCCRDMIAGDPIKDIDLAVDLPDGGVDFALYLYRKHMLAVKPILFRKFGTARIVLKKFPDIELEIVQTRKAKYTPENKLDPKLAFGTVEEDCLRRDLTINTLFYDITSDRLLDLTGRAIDDIRNRRISTPLSPEETFDDDPLRILRVVRFAVRYDAEIESNTLSAMTRMSPLLLNVSAERLRNELERILMGRNVRKAFELLLSIGALRVIIPELFGVGELQNGSQHGAMANLAHSLRVLNMIDSSDVALRWAALLHDIGKVGVTSVDNNACASQFLNHESQGARVARRILRRLRYDTSMVRRVMMLIESTIVGSPDVTGKWRLKDRQLRRIQLGCGSREIFDELLDLISANTRDHKGYGLDIDPAAMMRERTDEMMRSHTSMFNFKMAVTDDEIRALKKSESDGVVVQCRAHLLRGLCAEPGASKQQQIRWLNDFTPTADGYSAPVTQSHSTSNQSIGFGSRRPSSRASRRPRSHRRQRRS